ncbi:MAG TPA: NAD(P)-dependent oxidoreductase [Kofleriaceae bacterium]|nr:NAD(P)-dependent oxidoreductase [Kofleriaceae bacterium]
MSELGSIAVLGLGAMGSRIAARLRGAGHDVVVYNRSPEPTEALLEVGARVAATPRAAAAEADLVISMVTDDEASRVVWDARETGALNGLRAGALALESSTLSLAWTTELATRVGQRGAAFLDAPVAGSRPQAEAGQLIYLVGGMPEDVARVRPRLAPISEAVHHLGPVGAGMAMKLVVNALFGAQVAALAELLGIVRGAGLDERRMLELLGDLPVTSPAMKGICSLIASRSYGPMFPIDLVAKDLQYALAAAADFGAELPATTAVARAYEHASRQGFGADNIAGLAQLYDR